MLRRWETTLGNELHQSAVAVVVLGVLGKVGLKSVDSCGEKRNLNLC